MFRFESQGAVEVMKPEVAINQDNAEKFVEAFTEKSFVGQPMVVVDMNHVPVVDSAALEALLDVQKLIRESAGSMKIAGLTQLCEDVFRITGVAERFETYADTKTAIGSFVR